MYTEITEKYQKQRIAIAKTIKELLPYFGWDHQLISEAEAVCGFDQGYCWLLFGKEIANIIQFYENWHDQLMIDLLNLQESTTKIQVRQMISNALKIRIKSCDFQVNMKKNQLYFLKPENYTLGSKLAWQTCNKIWYYAGDRSIDFNYYTKRGLLFPVYVSSINYYLYDQSDQHQKTDQFIDQALAKIINIASLKNKIPKFENIPILRLFL
ncbi:MAG: COQ9 family protein [Rickettsiaceae bacterium]|nr:MAG: COQ9 family protein [Rickettsiaceae bacterium]